MDIKYVEVPMRSKPHKEYLDMKGVDALWEQIKEYVNEHSSEGSVNADEVNALIAAYYAAHRDELKGEPFTFEDLTEEQLALLKGADGAPGKDGADGYTPVKGVDYFDGVDGTVSFNELTEEQRLSLKGEKGDPGEPADVSALATKTELELKADKTALETLATKEELGLKANKTEIPDVTNLATKTELEAKLDKTQFESEKANFATKSELATGNGSARVSAVEGNKLELKEDGLYANGISITDLDEVDTGALKEELQNIANEVTNKMSVFNELTELDLDALKTQLKTEIKAELKEEILAELNASRGPA